MSIVPGDATNLRLKQLQSQARALRESLSLHTGSLCTESGAIPTWLKQMVAEMFCEARRHLPDEQYFSHASGCEMNLSDPKTMAEWITSPFECDAFLAMMEAAAHDYTGLAPRMGFRASEE